MSMALAEVDGWGLGRVRGGEAERLVVLRLLRGVPRCARSLATQLLICAANCGKSPFWCTPEKARSGKSSCAEKDSWAMATAKHWVVAAICSPTAMRRHARSGRVSASVALASGLGLRTRLRCPDSIYAPAALALVAFKAWETCLSMCCRATRCETWQFDVASGAIALLGAYECNVPGVHDLVMVLALGPVVADALHDLRVGVADRYYPVTTRGEFSLDCTSEFCKAQTH